MKTGGRVIAVVAALAAAAVAGSCGTAPGPVHVMATPGAGGPFAPVSIRIHGLTRLDHDSRGAPIIACHVEMRDAWGDTCKGVGRLRIELYRSTGGRGSAAGVQELRWDVDLSDLKRNAELYDPATRTYRLPLSNLPGWVEQAAAARPPGTPAQDRPDTPRITLRATLITTAADGSEHLMESEYTIEP